MKQYKFKIGKYRTTSPSFWLAFWLTLKWWLKDKLKILVVLFILSCSENPNPCPAILDSVNEAKINWIEAAKTTPESKGMTWNQWSNYVNNKEITYKQRILNAQRQGCI